VAKEKIDSPSVNGNAMGNEVAGSSGGQGGSRRRYKFMYSM
jgi:hypothetical protein